MGRLGRGLCLLVETQREILEHVLHLARVDVIGLDLWVGFLNVPGAVGALVIRVFDHQHRRVCVAQNRRPAGGNLFRRHRGWRRHLGKGVAQPAVLRQGKGQLEQLVGAGAHNGVSVYKKGRRAGHTQQLALHQILLHSRLIPAALHTSTERLPIQT